MSEFVTCMCEYFYCTVHSSFNCVYWCEWNKKQCSIIFTYYLLWTSTPRTATTTEKFIFISHELPDVFFVVVAVVRPFVRCVFQFVLWYFADDWVWSEMLIINLREKKTYEKQIKYNIFGSWLEWCEFAKQAIHNTLRKKKKKKMKTLNDNWIKNTVLFNDSNPQSQY